MAPVTSYFDVRLFVYRALRRLLTILLIVFIIKFLVCDTAVLRTEQMEPTLQNGDRVLYIKTSFLSPWSIIFTRQINDCVIFKNPLSPDKTGCLRIAGLPGDSILIDQGTFSRTSRPAPRKRAKPSHEELLPADYSPRDFMAPYRMPKPGDTIFFDSLVSRNEIFFYSMMRQENPKKNYTLQPALSIDDSITNDYFIDDFSLFSGLFSTIPDSLVNNWFFWDRLQAFLVSKTDGKRVDIRFSIHGDREPIKQYLVVNKFYFLLADNWCHGYDSRYFGPVAATAIKGKAIAVLWSFAPDKHRNTIARSRRIGKIIK